MVLVASLISWAPSLLQNISTNSRELELFSGIASHVSCSEGRGEGRGEGEAGSPTAKHNLHRQFEICNALSWISNSDTRMMFSRLSRSAYESLNLPPQVDRSQDCAAFSSSCHSATSIE